MDRADVRSELLAEHASLRALIGSLRTAASEVRGSATRRADLRMAMGRLVHALHEHNCHEEQLLRVPSRRADAAEKARQEIMDSAHLAEHRELTEAFVDASSVSDAALANGILDHILDQVLAHMAREENVMIGEETPGGESAESEQVGT